MPRRRPKTDMYLVAVQDAVNQPGHWIEVPREFETEFNASITGSCLEGGYLRVQPQEGDQPVTVRGRRYIKTAAPVDARVTEADGKWRLSLRWSR